MIVRRYSQVCALLGLVVLLTHFGSNEPSATANEQGIVAIMPSTVVAGTAWEIQVAVTNALAGETIDILLINGVQQLTATLHLGPSGSALWRVEQGRITQVGRSLVVVQYEETQQTYQLHVTPAEPTTLEVFSTASYLTAYGDDEVMLIAFLSDAFGNPIEADDLQARLRTPTGDEIVLSTAIEDGLAWLRFQSIGPPGLIRAEVTAAALQQTLTITQHPSTAENIVLEITPACVLNDGLETITLRATIADATQQAIIDGSQVRFQWQQGSGTAISLDGQATLRIPSPRSIGLHRIDVNSDAATETGYLRVTGIGCR